MPELRIFLDASAVFAAVLAATGGARALLKLGETGVIQIWVGPAVLTEADAVFRRKAPDLLPLYALNADDRTCLATRLRPSGHLTSQAR